MNLLSMDMPAIVNLSLLSIVVIVAVKIVQLVRQRVHMEKSLAAFPTAPDRHWLLGHLPKVKIQGFMKQLLKL